MVHRLSSAGRAEWGCPQCRVARCANNGTLAWAGPLRIRRGLNKFSPWHSESIEFLTPYSAFVCFTWLFIPWEDTSEPCLHSLSAEWGVIVHLNDIETSWWLRPFQRNMCEVFIIIRIRDAGQSERPDLYFLLQLQLRKLFIALVELN